MSKYVEFRQELATNKTGRDCIVLLSELHKKVDPYKDSYRSLFYYDESILKHVTDKGTVSSFRGKAGADRLVWDFDNNDLGVARKDAVALVDRLINEYGLRESEVAVYFSGRKGFAIEILVDGIEGLDGVLDENIPILVKKLCTAIGGDLESFDRVIYNHNRLYRIAGTLHQKESEVRGIGIRLFKTSLPMHLFRQGSIDEIQEYSAKIQVPEAIEAISDISKISEKFKYIQTHVDEISREINTLPVAIQNGLPDEKEAPRNSKICIWRLCQGCTVSGRDNALLRVADHERKMGMPPEVIRAKIEGVLQLMNQRDPQKAKLDPFKEEDLDRIVRQVFNNDYDFGCNDMELDALCSKKCYLAPRKFNDSKADTVTLLDAYRRSKNFYQKYYENIVPTGFSAVDNHMPLFLSTFNLIVGKPGTGKTSLMLNIMKNASLSNIPALFFSMDMSEEMLIQRCAPILMVQNGDPAISGKDFMMAHARGDTSLMDKAQAAFEKISNNVQISSQRSMTVKDIEEEIDRQESLWGRKAKLVIVDYVQLLKSEKEGFVNDTFNAHALTELAKNKKVCLLGLSQTARSQQSNEFIFAKGSGAWEEQASTQINCFRPFKDKYPEYDWIMSLRMMKNRLGATDVVDMYFHGPSGCMRDLQESEQIELAALKDRLEHEKE